ncbi:DUF808 domain-containing protein [Uliginosibacterium flavum]|uniref:DUF808 domain-containing protein n=1 Tax=Uliginosibacterium flavum TaxID=1396831 RepID=A0ABV2TNQ6_9RHOO
MAASSLLALIDDIATILDDVAVMSKVAAKKTAGVLGDDLALNAQQVTGVSADRELPVVWAVALGSLRNKAILVPTALLISAFAPRAIIPLLMIGGAYLCFEGVEKLAHKFLHRSDHDASEHAAHLQALQNPAVDMRSFEREKIKGAVRTDFILSAEIIVISLGVVAPYPFLQQVIALCAVALLMTVGVYGFVALIVKLDDAGLYLSLRPGSKALRKLGSAILWCAPWLMKSLSIVGTLAMFLVGGGILLHGIPQAHDFIHHLSEIAGSVGLIGSLLQALTPTLLDALAGVLAGSVCLLLFTLGSRGLAHWRRLG